MTEQEKIKEEIERLYKHYIDAQEFDSGYNMALDDILQFIDSLPEANKDLDFLVISLEETIGTSPHSREVIKEHLQNAAEWQKQKDEKLFKEDSWNYIEENYPNISQEEKLRLYDISIKSRLAGANAIKEHMKETLQTEYEKGRFDMREELMEDAVDATIFSELKGSDGSVFQVKSDRFRMNGVKISDRIKVIPIKTEQQ